MDDCDDVDFLDICRRPIKFGDVFVVARRYSEEHKLDSQSIQDCFEIVGIRQNWAVVLN